MSNPKVQAIKDKLAAKKAAKTAAFTAYAAAKTDKERVDIIATYLGLK